MPVDVKLKAIKMVACVHDNYNSSDQIYSVVFNWQAWAYWTLQDQQNVYINSSEINIILYSSLNTTVTHMCLHMCMCTHAHDHTGIQKECNEERQTKQQKWNCLLWYCL